MRVLYWPITIAILVYGIYKFLTTRHTPNNAHQKMIDVFSRVGGLPLEILSIVLGKKKILFKSALIEGDLMNLRLDLSSLESLRKDGYITIQNALNREKISNLMEFSRTNVGLPRMMDGGYGSYSECKYDQGQAIAARFDFGGNDLVRCSTIQDLISSPKLISFVQNYLGCMPVLTNINMWWSAPVKAAPDYEAAQEWHFDMDRPKWLKCFIYITDVTRENGPHQFIKGTHRPSGIPISLRRFGYVRLSNELILDSFSASDIISFEEKGGTMIIEDTKGLHRGLVPASGERLILAIEFSSTLFGATYKKIKLPEIRTSQFNTMLQSNSKIFEIFEI